MDFLVVPEYFWEWVKKEIVLLYWELDSRLQKPYLAPFCQILASKIAPRVDRPIWKQFFYDNFRAWEWVELRQALLLERAKVSKSYFAKYIRGEAPSYPRTFFWKSTQVQNPRWGEALAMVIPACWRQSEILYPQDQKVRYRWFEILESNEELFLLDLHEDQWHQPHAPPKYPNNSCFQAAPIFPYLFFRWYRYDARDPLAESRILLCSHGNWKSQSVCSVFQHLANCVAAQIVA